MAYLKILTGVITICENWPHILLHKLLHIPIGSIKLRNGLAFSLVGNKIGKADLSILTEIWYNQLYLPPFMDIGPENIVFDVGGNKGYFSIQAARLAERGKVYSFEPVPEIFEQMKMNLSVNHIVNVCPNNLALTDKRGTVDFYLSSKYNSGAHSIFFDQHHDKKIRVPTDTLENFCVQNGIKRINFLKLDCEGSEFGILLNMGKQMLKSIDKIAMEYHESLSKHSHLELIDCLKAENFMVTVRDGYIYAINLSVFQQAP